MSKLALGREEIYALRYKSPHIESNYDIDFSGWYVNPDNSEGITIEQGKIIITKVKPNVWFIRSNYGFTADTERNEKFYNKIFKLSNVSANSSLISAKTVANTYTAQGIVISPCNSDGAFFSSSYPWDMGIPSGYFKYGPQGAVNFGYTIDCERALYNYNVNNTRPTSWESGYYEVGFAFYTNNQVGDDGYIQLVTPIIIESYGNRVLDPTTAEAWNVALGNDIIYTKEKTFNNSLLDFKIAYVEKDRFTYGEQTNGAEIYESTWDGNKAIAYVISNKNYPVKSDIHDILSIPYPSDLESLVKEGMPIKFWIKQQDIDFEDRPKFWESVIKLFKNTEITGYYGLTYLFSHSNISSVWNPSGDGYIDIKYNTSYNTVHPIDSIFDHSSIDKVRITITGLGTVTSILNAFRQCKNVQEVQFIGDSDRFNIHTWSGAFEYCSLPKFPDNIKPANSLKDNTCLLNYAFHGAVMPYVGNEEMYVKANESFQYAFDGWTGNEIKWNLDLSYVDPTNVSSAACLNCSNLEQAKIQGLNKGEWNLDGVNRVTNSRGNLTKLDADSVNYMLNNMYDLNQNHEEKETQDYTEGLYESNLYLPASLRDKMEDSAIKEANSRGWNIYTGGVLVELEPDVPTKHTFKFISAPGLTVSPNGSVDISFETTLEQNKINFNVTPGTGSFKIKSFTSRGTTNTGVVTFTGNNLSNNTTVTIKGGIGPYIEVYDSYQLTVHEPVVTKSFYLSSDKSSAYVGDSVAITAHYRVVTDGNVTNSNITSFSNVELTSTSGSLKKATNGQSYTLTKTTAGTVTVMGTWDGSVMGSQEMEETQTAEIVVEFINDTPTQNSKTILFKLEVFSQGADVNTTRYIVNAYDLSTGAKINVPCNVTIVFPYNNLTTKMYKGSSESNSNFTGAELGGSANLRILRVGTEDSSGVQTTYYDESTNTNYTFRANN